MTREEWSAQLLAFGEWAPSREKVDGLVAHQAAAARVGLAGRWNPLGAVADAPTRRGTGYRSFAAGIAATYCQLRTFPQLWALLEAFTGGSASAYCASPTLERWGTGRCVEVLEMLRTGSRELASAPIG